MSAPRTGYFTASHVSSLDDSEQPFALWVPRQYSPRRRYPLIVALHGSDADHRMIPEECLGIHRHGFREDVMLLCPFGRGDLDYRGPGEADLWDALRWVREQYSVDTRRQYLTGLSMGGYATWRLACEHPGQWAAIAPVCGGGDPAALKAIKRLPVWCVHGERDAVVPATESRRLVAELRRLKAPVRYDELHGWGHESWRWLYDPRRHGDTLADWFLRFRKAKAPRPVAKPARHGVFRDLFNERILVSYPARTPIPREAELLRAEAEHIARFSFGDSVMRSGHLVVKSDSELTPRELAGANHLMLGRTDNHACLAKVQRRLRARHVRGRLEVADQAFLGKSLIAATCQPSPWNRERLLGLITYQQFQQVRGFSDRLLEPHAEPGLINLYDSQQRRFLRR
jgi:poly(3-hydroxybutyrate) depolymerase